MKCIIYTQHFLISIQYVWAFLLLMFQWHVEMVSHHITHSKIQLIDKKRGSIKVQCLMKIAGWDRENSTFSKKYTFENWFDYLSSRFSNAIFFLSNYASKPTIKWIIFLRLNSALFISSLCKHKAAHIMVSVASCVVNFRVCWNNVSLFMCVSICSGSL